MIKGIKGDGALVVLCIYLAAACGFDYWRKRIPNRLLAVTAATGLMLRWGREGPGGILAYGGESLLIMALLFPLFKIGALGAGDVKLFGVTAGYLPFGKIFVFSFVSMLIAAVISLFKLLGKRRLRERLGIFLAYLKETADSGVVRAYPEVRGHKEAAVCLSGPVFFSILLFLGGVY